MARCVCDLKKMINFEIIILIAVQIIIFLISLVLSLSMGLGLIQGICWFIQLIRRLHEVRPCGVNIQNRSVEKTGLIWPFLVAFGAKEIYLIYGNRRFSQLTRRLYGVSPHFFNGTNLVWKGHLIWGNWRFWQLISRYFIIQCLK